MRLRYHRVLRCGYCNAPWSAADKDVEHGQTTTFKLDKQP
jgi:hypothetical protein